MIKLWLSLYALLFSRCAAFMQTSSQGRNTMSYRSEALQSASSVSETSPLGKPSAFWRLQSQDGAISRCAVETNGCGGYQQVDGYRGFVFDGKTPCLIQSLSFKEGGFGGNVWDSAIGLGTYLALFPDRVRGKVVVELGSGTGLSGLAAHAAGASKVVLTDCGLDVEDLATDESYAAYEALASTKRLVPLTLVQELRSTAQRNLDLLADSGALLETSSLGDLTVARLDWHEVAETVTASGATAVPAGTATSAATTAPGAATTQPETSIVAEVPQKPPLPSEFLPGALREADVVIGSDLVYYPEDIAPLVATVEECLKGPGPKTAVFMFPGRGHETRSDGHNSGSSGHRGETTVPEFVLALREALDAERAALLSQHDGNNLACSGEVKESYFYLSSYQTRELLLLEIAWPHQ